MNDFVIQLVLLTIILIIFGTAAYASYRAAPWLPVRKKDLRRIVESAQIGPHDVVYDLGSGDGRVVIAFARLSNARVVGFDISLLPYVYSRLRMLVSGLWRRVEIRFTDFFNADLSPATVVFCFLTPMAMRKLAPKFMSELHAGVRIISYSFSIPGWTAERIDKPHQDSIPIFVYRKQK
ncbi:MAG: class I SAM-dependent methyltransferase [Patescibacteria group bacterium]|jgi:tRNA A58 N-methylase Trm61